DDVPPALQVLNHARLVGRHHVGELAGEPEPRADGLRDHGIVAGQHDGVAYAHGVQAADDGVTLRPHLVGIGDKAAELAVDRDVKARIAVAVEPTTIEHRAVDIDTALAHEALAADVDVVAVDLAFDAEADAVLGLVAGWDVDLKLLRVGAQRLRHRVMEARFR